MISSSGDRDDRIDRALADWLKSGTLPDFGDAVQAYLHRIDLHGIAGVLTMRLKHHGKLPEALKAGLLARHFVRETWEIQHAKAVNEAVESLTKAGMKPLIFKGTALAWAHYERPAMRIRGDTDILIEDSGKDRAFAELRAAQFLSPLVAGGNTMVAEKLFQQFDAQYCPHDIDLHWRLNSSYVIHNAFSYQELASRAVPIARGETCWWRVSDVDLLLITCFHRQLHIDGSSKTTLGEQQFATPDRLIWLVDIDLLLKSLSSPDLEQFVRMAKAKGLSSVCREALLRVQQQLGTNIPQYLIAELKTNDDEPIAAYLAATRFKRHVMDFRACSGWRGKIEFIRELLLPNREYMLANFANGKAAPLPYLYIKRAWAGVRKYV